MFDGELTVLDGALLEDAVLCGLGEQIAMGAGLMTLEPVQRYRYV